jgi:hypothetical protein
MLRWSRLQQAESVSQIRRAQVFGWRMPSIAFVLIAGHSLACVLAYPQTAQINAAHRATDESGRVFLPGARPSAMDVFPTTALRFPTHVISGVTI